ncbi:MAG: hypothetical protein AAFY76_12705 [Cyanobacteria bacterium J06649_11]
MTKKINGRNCYSMLLPITNIEEISRQVLNPHTGGTYEKNSLLTIELLFSQVPELSAHFEVDVKRTDGFVKFKGDKVNFAKNVVPGIADEHFEVFRPIFDFINSKI